MAGGCEVGDQGGEAGSINLHPFSLSVKGLILVSNTDTVRGRAVSTQGNWFLFSPSIFLLPPAPASSWAVSLSLDWHLAISWCCKGFSGSQGG